MEEFTISYQVTDYKRHYLFFTIQQQVKTSINIFKKE